jgi:polysaccharide pyruvyl transferase CsaB
VGRKNPFSVLFAMLRSERFLCGGGSLLQNRSGKLSLLYYLFLLRLARLCGCKTELLSSGIGPIIGEKNKRRVAKELSHCERIALRDARSYRYLRSLGVEEEKLTILPDLALRLEQPPPSRLMYLLHETGMEQNAAYFCLALTKPKEASEVFLRTVSSAIRIFTKQYRMTPIFLVFDRNEDKIFQARIAKKTGGRVLCPRDVSEALAWLSGAKFLIGMRLHAILFSRMTSTPCIGISPAPNEPKLKAFCRTAGESCFSPDRLSTVALLSEMEKVLRNFLIE